MLEVAAGLMGVNEQSEIEILRHGDSFFIANYDNKSREYMDSSRGGREPNTHLGRTRQAVRNG
jgi:hypothetical protein